MLTVQNDLTKRSTDALRTTWNSRLSFLFNQFAARVKALPSGLGEFGRSDHVLPGWQAGGSLSPRHPTRL